MSISNNFVIEMNHVSKDFKVLNRHEGLKGSLKDLFSRDYKIVKAVNDAEGRKVDTANNINNKIEKVIIFAPKNCGGGQ